MNRQDPGLEVHSQPVSLGEVPGNILSVQLLANQSFLRVPAAISATQNRAPKWPPTLLCHAPLRMVYIVAGSDGRDVESLPHLLFDSTVVQPLSLLTSFIYYVNIATSFNLTLLPRH
jgi:hypothetical protein